MQRGALVEINLNYIAENYRFIEKLAGNIPIIPVVKADAYGHGLTRVTTHLERLNVFSFAVAYVCEAIELRESGIKKPIIVLFDNHPFDDIIKYNLTPVIYSEKTARDISSAALRKNLQIEIHVNIDTGMGRLGFSFDRDVKRMKEIATLEGIKIRGVMSHFSEADLSDREFAELQLERFLDMKRKSPFHNQKTRWHIANSAAVLTLQSSYVDAVRPGLMLYGCNPLTQMKQTSQSANNELKPAMTVKTKLLDIRRIPSGRPISYGRTFITKRDSLIGVLPVGYGDGYPRMLSNKAYAIVKGKIAPIVGRVCMDITTIDITDVEDVALDDEVVLLGRVNNLEVSADELAKQAGTISYEILTSLGRMNRKEYIL